MAKASRQIREKLKLIDIVVEVLDARLPIASKNPDIDQYTEHKRHLVLLNKADLADPDQNQKWADYLKGRDGVDEVMLYNAFDQKKKPELVAKLRSLNPKDKKQLKCLIDHRGVAHRPFFRRALEKTIFQRENGLSIYAFIKD